MYHDWLNIEIHQMELFLPYWNSLLRRDCKHIVGYDVHEKTTKNGLLGQLTCWWKNHLLHPVFQLVGANHRCKSFLKKLSNSLYLQNHKQGNFFSRRCANIMENSHLCQWHITPFAYWHHQNGPWRQADRLNQYNVNNIHALDNRACFQNEQHSNSAHH